MGLKKAGANWVEGDLRYLMSVPEEEEALSEEGRRLLEEGWEDIEAGRLVGSDEAKRELGL